MPSNILGLHHVTAITGDPQLNINFYAGFLGMRLVKLTVNFDDPSAYHLYYGDGDGSPGSLVTFFAWPGAFKGRQGTGQAIVLCLSIPQASLGYWIERCASHGVKIVNPFKRFDETVLLFTDPDGMTVELVAHPDGDKRPGWKNGPVPHEHSIRGLHSVTLLESGFELVESFLKITLGFRSMKEDQNVYRFSMQDNTPGSFIDVKVAPDLWKGSLGVGTIHHIAYRVSDDASQLQWRQTLVKADANVSPVIDREYFHSIYFNEPGGVLFEIATDPPGMDIDEPKDKLGTSLKLPPSYESRRAEIEAALPPLRLPTP